MHERMGNVSVTSLTLVLCMRDDAERCEEERAQHYDVC